MVESASGGPQLGAGNLQSMKYQSLNGVNAVEPNKKAFTLIELIIVIFIIGMASAVVGGSLYRNMDDIRLKTAAKEMVAILRYARSRSVAEKKFIRLLRM